MDGFESLVYKIRTKFPFLPGRVARRLARAYGTDTWSILAQIHSVDDLGDDFGAGVYAAELDWAIEHEWVSSAEDFVWRRTRLGLRLSKNQIATINDYVKRNQINLAK